MKKTASRRVAAILITVLAAAVRASAADSAWNTNAGGVWSLPDNWTSGIPGAQGTTNNTDVATFNRSTISNNAVVVLDTNYNLGGITFSNDGTAGSAQYAITNSNSAVLTLSAGAVVRSIGNRSGPSTLNVPVVILGSISILNSNANGGGNLQFGVNGGVRSITAAADLGNVTVTIGGNNNNANNLIYSTFNQGTNTTLGIVKEGSGTWQLNNIGGTMTGGILVKGGTLQFGQGVGAALGTLTLGDPSSSGDIVVGPGSSVTVGSPISVPASPAASVFLSRAGGGGAASYSNNINLGRDLLLRQGTTANQALNLTANSSVTGSGNLIISSSVTSAGAFNLQGSISMSGELRNLSATNATGTVTVSGALGTNVTAIVQNSANSPVVISSSNGYAGNIVISNGQLQLGTNGVLKFIIGAPGTNNAVTGAGSFTAHGRFTIDLAGASAGNGDTWTLVACPATYGTNFLVNGFSGSGGLWTNTTNGVSYVFSQTAGTLTVVAAPTNGYSSWVTYWQGVEPGFTNTTSGADPESDGFVNSLEFAFDGNPMVGSPSFLTAAKSGTNALFSYVARNSGVTYLVEEAANVATGPWTNSTVVVTNSADTNGINVPADYTRKEFTVPASGNQFYRVRATFTP